MNAVVLLACLQLLYLPQLTTSNDVREYCDREYFQPECGSDEVIMVHSAYYGRMRRGKCVTEAYGALGCQDDVLHVLYTVCSGRPSCRLLVSDLQEVHGFRTCPKDLMSYLGVNFTCVKVAQCPTNAQCNGGGFLRLSSTSGYLASTVAAQDGCGSVGCPWSLEPRPGQRINITFFNYIKPSASSSTCKRLAEIVDKTTMTSIEDVLACNNKRNKRSFMTPVSVPVLIRMYPAGGEGAEQGHFVVHYQVVGCPELDPPSSGWMKRSPDGNVQVGCDDNSAKTLWRLQCIGTAWLGEIGTCDNADVDEDSDSWSFGTTLKQAGTTHGLLLVVGIGVVLGVILGFTMLTGAILYLRRTQRRRYYEQAGRLAATHAPPTDRCAVMKTYDKAPATPTADKHLTPDELNAYRTYHAHEGPVLMRQQSEPRDKSHVTSVPVPVAPPPPLLYQGDSGPGESVTHHTGKLQDHVYESPHLSGPAGPAGLIGPAPLKKCTDGPKHLLNRASLT